MAPTSLRSAATHYKLLPGEDKLMLKGKEVISDPQKQYEIARGIHVLHHGGINKTTAIIAEKYHWVRIKETVSLVIKNCGECKELGKAPIVKPDFQVQLPRQPTPKSQNVTNAGILSLPQQQQQQHFHKHQQAQPTHLQHDFQQIQHHHHDHTSTSVSPQVLNRRLPSPSPNSHTSPTIHHKQHQPPISQMQLHHAETRTQSQTHSQSHTPSHRHPSTDYLQIDPQIMDYTHISHSSHPHFEAHHVHETDSFQAMLGDGDVDGDADAHVEDGESGVGGDINDMLIDHDEVEIERQVGDIGTSEHHHHIGSEINHNGTMSEVMGDGNGNGNGNGKLKSHHHDHDHENEDENEEDVMATARAAQDMISRGVMGGNTG